MPRKVGCSKSVRQANIRMLRGEGRPLAQAIAIAFDWYRQDCKKSGKGERK